MQKHDIPVETTTCFGKTKILRNNSRASYQSSNPASTFTFILGKELLNKFQWWTVEICEKRREPFHRQENCHTAKLTIVNAIPNVHDRELLNTYYFT